MTKTKTKTKTKTMTKTNTSRKHLQRAILENCDLWDIWSEWHDLTNKKTMTKTNTKTMAKTNQGTCDIWDTDNNSENWEPESMTIFVTWQLRVTLDSIRNSCDVYMHMMWWNLSLMWLLAAHILKHSKPLTSGFVPSTFFSCLWEIINKNKLASSKLR